eukprot:Colp12_sorted_trinity150504_noHs@26730
MQGEALLGNINNSFAFSEPETGTHAMADTRRILVYRNGAPQVGECIDIKFGHDYCQINFSPPIPLNPEEMWTVFKDEVRRLFNINPKLELYFIFQWNCRLRHLQHLRNNDTLYFTHDASEGYRASTANKATQTISEREDADYLMASNAGQGAKRKASSPELLPASKKAWNDTMLRDDANIREEDKDGAYFGAKEQRRYNNFSNAPQWSPHDWDQRWSGNKFEPMSPHDGTGNASHRPPFAPYPPPHMPYGGPPPHQRSDGPYGRPSPSGYPMDRMDYNRRDAESLSRQPMWDNFGMKGDLEGRDMKGVHGQHFYNGNLASPFVGRGRDSGHSLDLESYDQHGHSPNSESFMPSKKRQITHRSTDTRSKIENFLQRKAKIEKLPEREQAKYKNSTYYEGKLLWQASVIDKDFAEKYPKVRDGMERAKMLRDQRKGGLRPMGARPKGKPYDSDFPGGHENDSEGVGDPTGLALSSDEEFDPADSLGQASMGSAGKMRMTGHGNGDRSHEVAAILTDISKDSMAISTN